jgi:Flp pilus assembly protein CpaB
MRRGRTLIFVFLIIIIAAVVVFLVYTQYFAKPAAPVAPASVEVYIAGQNIPQGGTIKPELLATIKIAPENVVEVMYTIDEQAALVGKAAKFPLEQGVVITSSMVGDSSTSVPISGPSWATLIPPGMTAISIPASRFSLSGYAINDGAHVNLNACFLFVDVDPTFQTILPNQTGTLLGAAGTGKISVKDGTTWEGFPILTLGSSASGTAQGRLELDPSVQQPYLLLPSEAQRPRMVCQMMLQDVVVMKMGNFSREAEATIKSPSVPPTTDANGQPVQTNPEPDIVTLIVTPQDSITLSYLVNIQQTKLAQTRLSLTLRNPTDQARQATEASTLQFLLSQYNIPVPAKLPYALQPALPALLEAPTPAPQQ